MTTFYEMEFLFSSGDVDMVFILFNGCHVDLGP